MKFVQFTFVFLALTAIGETRRPTPNKDQPIDEDFLDEVAEIDNFICPEKFGYFADDSDCSRYHQCDHGKSQLRKCDDGLVFSTVLKTCDWPYNVHCNSGNRGLLVGRKQLRIKAPSESKNEELKDTSNSEVPSGRREALLSYDDDWLGRPESTLLALGDDDAFYDSFGYEESQRIRPLQQPEVRRVESTQPKSISQNNNKIVADVNDQEENGPWFNSLNFDQAKRDDTRRQRQRKQQQDSNHHSQQSTTTRRAQAPITVQTSRPITITTTTTDRPITTTISPTTVNPFQSSNGRGSGWRHISRTSSIRNHPTTVPLITTTIRPRGRIVEEFVDEVDHDVRRTSSGDNFRLIPTTTTVRIPVSDVHITTTEAPRAQRIGSSRRRVYRKQQTTRLNTIFDQTTPTQAFTTVRPSSNTRQWTSRTQTPSVTTTFTGTVPVQDNFRRTIPELDSFKQFARRPVLRDQEDAPPGRDSDDYEGDLDDNFYQPLEIRKKHPSSVNDDDEIPTVIVPGRDLSHNSLDIPSSTPKRRRPTTTSVSTIITTSTPASTFAFQSTTERPFEVTRHTPLTPPPPSTLTPKSRVTSSQQPQAQQQQRPKSVVDQEAILKAFQVGFKQAVKPPQNHKITSTPTVNQPNNGRDMEYEDITSDDEDEDVREPSVDERHSQEDPHTGSPKKEIVVKYDDDDDDEQVVKIRPTTNFQKQQTSTLSSGTFQPRLTEFVDVFLNNKPKHNNQTGTSFIELNNRLATLNQQWTPNPNFISNFGQNLTFPLLTSTITPFGHPKHQPRSIATFDNDDQNFLKEKKKIKIKMVKKIQKGTNKPVKPRIQSSHPKIFQAGTYRRAKKCDINACQLPNCRCGGFDIPGNYRAKDIPQIVLLTFDDSINDLNRDIYRKLFEQGRKNPNGCPIRSTFYVSHEWTDYAQLQNLYSNGHEMASHTISHSFGEKFSKSRWLAEVAGQREIMHLYGGVDWHDIRGMRAPFLQTGGNTMFEMLKEANFTYDSSMPVYDIDPPLWPYTLDYSLNHECMIEPCPSSSIPGLWEVGMVMWEDNRGGRCSMADGCFNPADDEGVYQMVKKNFLRHYNSNRSPFGMYFHSRWFLNEHNMKGFIRAFDEMLQNDDVYVVTNWQMIQWMRQPTPLSSIKNFSPFGCDDMATRPEQCTVPHTCKVKFRHETRTLRTCQSCPRHYPWTGHVDGNSDGDLR